MEKKWKKKKNIAAEGRNTVNTHKSLRHLYPPSSFPPHLHISKRGEKRRPQLRGNDDGVFVEKNIIAVTPFSPLIRNCVFVFFFIRDSFGENEDSCLLALQERFLQQERLGYRGQVAPSAAAAEAERYHHHHGAASASASSYGGGRGGGGHHGHHELQQVNR